VVRRALLCAVALAFIACTALLGIDKDYRLGGGDAATDAAPDITDEPIDAGSDATYCSRQMHTFCEDFDLTSLGLNWSVFNIAPLGTMKIDDLASVSPPKSLFCQTPMAYDGGDGNQVNSNLMKRISGTYSQISMDTQIRVEGAPADSSLKIGRAHV